MGGAGDLQLIYAVCVLSGARRVVETGVALGWSSLVLLHGLRNSGGQLVSVDMPYPKLNNESWVGAAVPEEYKDGWVLVRRPDRYGLNTAIAFFRGEIDLVHYDSDKSYHGRMFGYRRLWRALRPGGVFISDDIQDNMAFRDFFAKQNVAVYVCQSGSKFVGVARRLH
jgi:predicted O-methyltransferase YrrM